MVVKKIIIAVVLIVVVTSFAMLLSSWLSPEYPKSVLVGGTEIFVDIAATNLEKISGLSGRQTLFPNKGMLFFFEEDSYPGIWMKDMLFSIDIVWINSENRIVHVEKEISPETFPKIFLPEVPATYVLELSSGFLEEKGIKVGDEVKFLY